MTILKCLRGEHNYDKLVKLRPFIQFLKKLYLEIFTPSRFLSIDERMVDIKAIHTKQTNKTRVQSLGVGLCCHWLNVMF